MDSDNWLDRFEPLSRLRAAIAHDDAGVHSPQARALRWERMTRRLQALIPKESLHAQLHSLIAVTQGDLCTILPSHREVMDDVIGHAQPLRGRLPLVTTELNLSTPVAFPQRACVGFVTRLHDAQGRWQAKIRIAAFTDPQGKPFWEVGYVDRHRSLQRFRRNFIEAPAAPTDASMLRHMVHATWALARQRRFVQGLDLTPAHYHVLGLCRAVGGRPAPGVDLARWQQRMVAAARHTLQQGQAFPERVTAQELCAVKLRDAIAWMFACKCMLDPETGGPLVWEPPRLIRPTWE